MTDLIDGAVRWGGALLCLLVALGCAERIRLMYWATHRVSVYATYLCMGAYAGGVLTDLCLNYLIDWYEGAGIAGCALHLVHTQHEWRHNKAPTDSERAALGER